MRRLSISNEYVFVPEEGVQYTFRRVRNGEI